MKKLLLVTTPLLLVACAHNMATIPSQTPAQSTLADLPTETPRQGRYIALPGQAAVDTDAAFEQQVAAYNNPSQVPAAPTVPSLDNALGGVPAAPAAPVQTTIPTATGTAVVTTPAPVPTYPSPVTVTDGQVGSGAAAIAGGAAAVLPPADTTPVGGLVDYTLRVTNATSGRVFVEAQDAAGEIYPCGFMTGSQSISSEKKQVAPIKGPITVVVRDPDKPDAPELRRYKVDPPSGYAGKTLEITIISGGLYQVSVDGQVRYITPTPVGKPDLGNAASTPAAVTAAEEAAKAAAAAPAPEPQAPAPEQTPAGM